MAQPKPRSHRIILEIRATKSVLVCQHCDRPISEIAKGELTVESRHGSERHVNVLTVEYLNILVSEMLRQRDG